MVYVQKHYLLQFPRQMFTMEMSEQQKEKRNPLLNSQNFKLGKFFIQGPKGAHFLMELMIMMLVEEEVVMNTNCHSSHLPNLE